MILAKGNPHGQQNLTIHFIAKDKEKDARLFTYSWAAVTELVRWSETLKEYIWKNW